MNYVNLEPKRDFHTTGSLTSVLKDVAPLPVTRYQLSNGTPVTASFYRVSFWNRLKFLFCGRIFVSLYGKTHQPISIGIGQLFVKAPKGNK